MKNDVAAKTPAAARDPGARPARRRARATGSRQKDTARTEEATVDRNEVVLCGELARAPVERELADGTVSVTFVVAVRGAGAKASDLIDCVARAPDLRRKLRGRRRGDRIMLEGRVRRRFWRSATGLVSRYEVEALTAWLNRSIPSDRRSVG